MCLFISRVHLKMPKRSLKKSLMNNLRSRNFDSSQEHLVARPIRVSQTPHSEDSLQENVYENNQVSARPTRAAKTRCVHNLTNIIQAENAEQRERRLQSMRENKAHRLATENDVQREQRLQLLRQRAQQRIATENEDQRKQRLQYLRQRAQQRIATENDDQRKQRLQYLRQRAQQRRATENDDQREQRLQDLRQRRQKQRIANYVEYGSSEAHKVLKCNFCHSAVDGFRYTCVQCADFTMCSACEARAVHADHYVLRVPKLRLSNEIKAVLDEIRLKLFPDELKLSDDEDDNNDLGDNDDFKIELKEEAIYEENPLEEQQLVLATNDTEQVAIVPVQVNDVYPFGHLAVLGHIANWSSTIPSQNSETTIVPQSILNIKEPKINLDKIESNTNQLPSVVIKTEPDCTPDPDNAVPSGPVTGVTTVGSSAVNSGSVVVNRTGADTVDTGVTAAGTSADIDTLTVVPSVKHSFEGTLQILILKPIVEKNIGLLQKDSDPK